MDVDPVAQILLEASSERGWVIDRRRLAELGIRGSRVVRLVQKGILHPRHGGHGVFTVGRPEVSAYGDAWAAFVATRGRGVEPRRRALTARSARSLLGIGARPEVPEVVVVACEPPRVAGVRTSSTRSLPASDIWMDSRGLLCTSWTRTMLSLAAVSSVAELEDVLDRSDRRGLLDVVALDAAMRDARGRAGTIKLRRALEPFVAVPPAEYLSHLERLARVEFARGGLPEPEVNGPVVLPGGMTIHVDLLLRSELLALELDGRDVHTRIGQFETDRWRDRELQKLGFRVLRFSWRDAVQRPHRLVGDVRAMLDGRAVAIGSASVRTGVR